MNILHPAYFNRAELWLLISTLGYFLLNGAQLFETAVLVPKWSSRSPQSLSVLQGEFAPDLKTFWIIAHSLHELTFIAAIVCCWQLTGVRNSLLVIFGLHFAVRLWTIGYFAPQLMGFQKMDVTQVSDHLTAAVLRWKNLNYFRVLLFMALSVWFAWVYVQLKNKPNIQMDKMMEQRLSVITLGVDDLAAQTAFYKTKLGWTAVAENKDIVFFKLNGFLFSLLDRKALAEGAGVSATGSGFRGLTLSYNLPEKAQVDQLYTALQQQGVHILKAPVETPFGGYYFTFADPELNVLEVAFNPYIPLDHDSNVITHRSIENL